LNPQAPEVSAPELFLALPDSSCVHLAHEELIMSTTLTPAFTRLSAITGDRPTGPLHLGHYVGSLRNRLVLQDTHDLIVLVADLQALTDNAGNPQKIAQNIPEVMKDYLAVGLDPERTTFVLQSAVPELSELSMLLLNLVTVSQLERNPTVRAEIKLRGFQRDVPAGFLCYPAAQAADIIGLGAGLVPVGDDQLPMIELTNVIIDRLNRMAEDAQPLARCQAMLSNTTRLPGIYGGAKMSKSQGNAVTLGASAEELRKAVMEMYTDPNHVRVDDPGQVEDNVVFAYLDAFDPDTAAVADLKDRYRAGGLGDMLLKRRLGDIMEAEMAPIRERRASLEGQTETEEVMGMLRQGTEKARVLARSQLNSVKNALGVYALG
jgi:tryptophanyl-tRNA synthetase